MRGMALAILSFLEGQTVQLLNLSYLLMANVNMDFKFSYLYMQKQKAQKI